MYIHAKMAVSCLLAGCSSVLMFAKEFIKDSALQSGVSPTAAGFLAGAGGGVCQVSVMGPCTFLVTSVVTNKNISLTQQIKSTWQAKARACGCLGLLSIRLFTHDR